MIPPNSIDFLNTDFEGDRQVTDIRKTCKVTMLAGLLISGFPLSCAGNSALTHKVRPSVIPSISDSLFPHQGVGLGNEVCPMTSVHPFFYDSGSLKTMSELSEITQKVKKGPFWPNLEFMDDLFEEDAFSLLNLLDIKDRSKVMSEMLSYGYNSRYVEMLEYYVARATLRELKAILREINGGGFLDFIHVIVRNPDKFSALFYDPESAAFKRGLIDIWIQAARTKDMRGRTIIFNEQTHPILRVNMLRTAKPLLLEILRFLRNASKEDQKDCGDFIWFMETLYSLHGKISKSSNYT